MRTLDFGFTASAEEFKFDGWIASKFGITAMAPTGFIVGFALAYFVF